jgi:ubiquinone/menaquinone biosynthesis C-methylase UbiE
VALYDRIGAGYDARRRAAPGIVARLRELLPPDPTGRFLDLGCGTGNYTRALAQGGGAWVGVDASEVMLSAARARGDGIAWHLANVAALPFPDAVFDAAVSTLALHHFDDLEAAFREARRVLRGGPLVLFACERGRTQGFWLRAYFPRMFERMVEMGPSEAEMRTALEAAGFTSIETEPWSIPDDLVDHFLYAGKLRPELYFDPALRAGISCFANQSTPEEVDEGLARLRADIDSGRFEEVAAAHPTQDGDYLFLVASG